MKIALVDADVLRYEVGSVGQDKDGNIKSFDFVKEVFDERIRTIVSGCEVGGYRLFLTGDKATCRIASRATGVPVLFTPNFREALAVGKVYKGTRKQDRPFHWINLTAYICSLPDTSIATGCEADDAIGICARLQPNDSIICTRDKDLRQVPGWHYGWECGKQPEFGPVEYDDIGKIELVRTKSTNKIVGGGWAFFCAQLLTGDVVDNIGGAKGIGPVKGYELLRECFDRRSYFDVIIRCYQENYGERWLQELSEQCQLLWIVRERLPDGGLKHFNLEEWL